DARALPDDPAEAVVFGNLPADRHAQAERARTIQNLAVQPRPQDDAIRERIPRGHAESEGVRVKARLALASECGERTERNQRGDVAAHSEEVAPGTGRVHCHAIQTRRCYPSLRPSPICE